MEARTSEKKLQGPRVWPRSPKRLALAGLGIVCVGLAFAGAVLPGLPTTVFLIAASYLFTRSCPWLEERLIRVRWFRPYLPYLDGSQPMPARARWIALAAMWSAVSLSLAVTAVAGRLHPAFAVTVVTAAAVGTWVIWRSRRELPLARVTAEESSRATNRKGQSRVILATSSPPSSAEG